MISALSGVLRTTLKARQPVQPPSREAAAAYSARSRPISRSASWP
ncbi:Uncharacterised protein [Bordetella pertussis]|nr:Uncharacterised protein [Bordetella pertussis]